MKVQYRANFTLGADEAHCPPHVEVAKCISSWALARRPRSVPQAALPLDDPRKEVPRTSLGNDVYVETACAALAGQDLWGLKYQHPQQDDPDLVWSTDVATVAEATGIHVGITVSVGATKGLVVPVLPRSRRPQVVPALIESFGARHGRPVLTRPQRLQSSGCRDFIAMLADKARRLPVVLVTCRNVDDKPIADAAAVADWLAGLAHVVVATDRFASFKLADFLPRHLNCWDGAVRIYWPGFDADDPSYRHRMFTGQFVRDFDTERNGFVAVLLESICETAAYAYDPGAPTWDMIQAAHRRKLRDDLRSAGQERELLDVFEEENQQLEVDKRALSESLKEASRRVDELQREAEGWKEACLEAMKQRAFSVSEAGPPPQSVSEAVDRAMKAHSNRLVLQLNSRSDRKTPYKAPAEVLNALDFLATVYADSITGTARCPDFDLALRAHCGWSFKSSAEGTMKENSDWYTVKRDGKTVWLKEHVGRGTSKDPRETIRIAFDWLEAEKKVLIGFIGQHQETDQT